MFKPRVVARLIGVFGGLVIVDQLSKGWQETQAEVVYNSGVAFSLAGWFAGWGWVLAVFLLGLSWWGVRRLPEWVETKRWGSVWGVCLVLAGGWSNWGDRLLNQGRVRDFIKFWIWPSFNLADVWVTLGTVLLILDYLTKEWRENRDTV